MVSKVASKAACTKDNSEDDDSDNNEDDDEDNNEDDTPISVCRRVWF